MKHLKFSGFIAFTVILIMPACNSQKPSAESSSALVSVKVAEVRRGDIEKTITLGGRTLFIKKNNIVSPISGYINQIKIKYGDIVTTNDVLFELMTKESKALKGEEIKAGVVSVNAPFTGIVDELNATDIGEYVTEGSLLCSIVATNSLKVQVNVPYDYHSKVNAGTKCTLLFPDSTSVPGTVSQVLPFMDSANQTQNVLIEPSAGKRLPENLNLQVQLSIMRHSAVLLVPRESVMSNETQSEFWVMKIINNNLALKTPVKKGIEKEDVIEISSTGITEHDMVITEGAYELPDSTTVRIIR